MLLYAVLPLFLLAILLLWYSSRRQRETGLPGGRVIYTDTSAWGAVESPLYDPITQVTGRPDYLVRAGKAVIPVEVKSGWVPKKPYDSHIYQVAAYCLLVERKFGHRPPYGIIQYDKQSFAIDYTPALEHALMEMLTEMRRAERQKDVPRTHDLAGRCRGCGFAYTCDQRL